MRHLIFFFILLTIANVSLAQNPVVSKSYFISAKQEIENMLNGKETPNYEKAIFIMENAYYENSIDKQSYDIAMHNHISNINEIIKMNYDFLATNPKPNLLNSKEELERQYEKALINWAIYTYITSDVGFLYSHNINYHKKYYYSATDPMASNDWTNTQVIKLNNTHQGNCFALASFFKLLSNRLNSEANLCTAPSHIYISHKDNKGTTFNVELGSKKFPGTGTLSVLTHSSTESIKNDIALRELNEKQSVALCLIYLAKGYQHKFNNTSDDFILQCAETAIKYDDKNLNALLLKAEYLENKLTGQHKSIQQLLTLKEFIEYQTLIANLYNLGYREMPLEMKNQLIKGWSKDTVTKLAKETYARSEANQKNQLQARRASLSWGLFDEDFTNKPTERIGNALFNTKTKKIISFAKEQNLYNNYNFDPVVFAWNIDPLAQKFPNVSPYAFCANNPIYYIDKDGKEPRWGQLANKKEILGEVHLVLSTSTNINTVGQKLEALSNHFASDTKYARGENGMLNVVDQGVDRYVYTEKSGWIDMHHFYELANYSRENGEKAALLYSVGSEMAQSSSKSIPFMGDKTASGYSYEDLPSDYAGIQFWKEYGAKIEKGEYTIEQATRFYLDDQGVKNPETAPNYKYIPHFVNSQSNLKNDSFIGLTGDNLGDKSKEVYDKRSDTEKKNIEEAHTNFTR